MTDVEGGPGPGLLGLLMKAVGRLALPADAQLKDLQQRGLLPNIDELALELEDTAVLLPQFVANGWMRDDEAAAVNSLASLLEAMSNEEDLWTPIALREAPEWDEVRDLARRVLMQ